MQDDLKKRTDDISTSNSTEAQDGATADYDARSDAPSYWDITWRQFKKRRLAYGSVYGAVVLILIAVYVPVLASGHPFFFATIPPSGTSTFSLPWLTSLFDRNVFESALDIFFNALLIWGTLLAIPVGFVFWRKRHLPRRPRRRAKKRALLTALAVFFGLFVATISFSDSRPLKDYHDETERLQAQGIEVRALFPPLPFSFRDTDLDNVRGAPSWYHWLGTDDSGRDVMVRMLYGTRISLTVGFFAVALYIVIGTALGAMAGYFGGRIDAWISRAIEVVMSIPSLFLILTVAAFIEHRSIFHIMVIIAAVSWTTPARLVRAEFLRLRNLDFVAAARAVGYSENAIMFRQILPNALGPVLVTATFGVASAILVESTMSFLGLGDITLPSWGQILNTGRTTGMWSMILAPGFAIFITVSLLNLIGDGLRDALDPKMRR